MISEKEKHCKNILEILATIGDYGLEESDLKIQLEIKALSPMTHSDANRFILHCIDKGWIARRTDDFDNVRVFITPAGRNVRMGG